jgi:hypothetical protein
MAATVQGGQSHYFSHAVMRFFSQTLLGLPYEELQPPFRRGTAPFCFDPATRTIYRPSDPLSILALRDFPTRLSELRHLAVSFVRRRGDSAERRPLFRIPGLRSCGMVIHPRDNATVIVARRPRTVWKLVHDASHNAVLENERTGAGLVPSLAPSVLEWQPAGEASPGYVRLEYALDTEPITAADLPAVLRRITPGLIDGYRASGVTHVTADAAYADLLDRERSLGGSEPTPLTSAALDVLGAIRRAFARHAERREPALHRAFAHGDIQASNLRRNGDRIALIDWANGGVHNVLFDAFVVELFSPTPGVWHDVFVNGTVDAERGFQRWLPCYLDRLATTAGLSLSPHDVAAGLICSMAEKTSAIVARHAGADEARGLHSLARVQRLLAGAGQPA